MSRHKHFNAWPPKHTTNIIKWIDLMRDERWEHWAWVVLQQNYVFDDVYKVFYLFKMISLRATALAATSNNLVFQPNETMISLEYIGGCYNHWINFLLHLLFGWCTTDEKLRYACDSNSMFDKERPEGRRGITVKMLNWMIKLVFLVPPASAGCVFPSRIEILLRFVVDVREWACHIVCRRLLLRSTSVDEQVQRFSYKHMTDVCYSYLIYVMQLSFYSANGKVL